MIFKFRIISGEEKDFVRDLEIPGTASFLDFHTAIQKELHYDATQLASFFLTDDGWEKELEITLIDMMSDGFQTPIIMKDAIIEAYINAPKERMLYVFDFFSERAFFIECMEIFPEIAGQAYPLISYRQGDPPQQIMIAMDDVENESEESFLDDMFSDDAADEDIDEDFLNEAGFNEFYPED